MKTILELNELSEETEIEKALLHYIEVVSKQNDALFEELHVSTARLKVAIYELQDSLGKLNAPVKKV